MALGVLHGSVFCKVCKTFDDLDNDVGTLLPEPSERHIRTPFRRVPVKTDASSRSVSWSIASPFTVSAFLTEVEGR